MTTTTTMITVMIEAPTTRSINLSSIAATGAT
jgi:hypothetical protein